MSDPLTIADDKRAGRHTSFRTRLPLIAAIALLLVILGAIFLPKLHYVDERPAVAFGEELFSKLKQDQLDDALTMYTDGFREKCGEEWHQRLAELDAQNGSVTDFTSLGFAIAPLQLHNSEEIACVLAHYRITRNKLVSQEDLTICPHQRSADWGIAGHKITRSDNGQQFKAGLTISEKTIFSTE